MTQPLGIDDFFVLEASDYLDRLAALSGNTTAPSADELVRFTRALRGSALMANQQPIARTAGGLEHLVRAYRDGRRAWDGDLSSLVREAVDMLRTLVERVRSWTPDDTARAERLALQLEAAAGGGTKPAPAVSPPPSEAGVRAFLARESAALGSVLDQAARIFQTGTASPDTLQIVLRRMQPLRGLAALTDFPPLPDVLDGIERTLVGVSRLEITPSSGGGRLEAAARALARAARDIADRGKPDLEGAEFRGFATLLLASEDEEQPAVPIESLFFAGENGIVQRGFPPRGAMAGGMGAAAVVSRGEHLCQAADEIAEASTATQRDLRLHVLVGDLKTLGNGLPTGLDVAVEAFGVAARAAVARGAAARDSGSFASLIRDAGVRLRGFNEVTQPASLVQAFEYLIAELDRLATPTGAVPHVAMHPAAPPVEPMVEEAVPEPEPVLQPAAAAEAVDDESDVVPIESLAPDEPEVAPLPEAAMAVAEPVEAEPEIVVVAQAVSYAADESGWDLAASYGRYEALVAGTTVVEAAAPAPAEASVPAPVEVAKPQVRRPEPVFTAAPAPAVEPSVVEIADLCYRGRSALERADVVRREIRFALAIATPQTALQPLVDELLDLVELALVD
jgi:chemotaxis protein histidine kinase CheA